MMNSSPSLSPCQKLRDVFLAVAAILFFLLEPAAGGEPVRVMTFNIRYGTAPDGENAWPHRRELVFKVIRDFSPDILGLQEALRSQIDELESELPEYTRVGVGRDADGGGEYSALLIRKARFDLSDAGTFWLSATPETPGSRTWGNNLPRIVTWARMLDRTNSRRLIAANTHWDHESQPARLESAQLMAERLRQLSASGEPVVVTGDFNAAPNNPAIPKLIEGAELKDSFSLKHPDKKDIGTFNGFGERLQPFKIDSVFINDKWEVDEAEIVRTKEGDRYPSDHFPVTATLTLR
jgi:endonuclease/exonuclease/phosphatase family metal-dependent hydrolase